MGRLPDPHPAEGAVEEGPVLDPQREPCTLCCHTASFDGEGRAGAQVLVAIMNRSEPSGAEWVHEHLLEFLEAVRDHLEVLDASGQPRYPSHSLRCAQGWRMSWDLPPRLPEVPDLESLRGLSGEVALTAEQIGILTP